MSYRVKHDPAELLRQGEKIATSRNVDTKYKFRVVTVPVLSKRCTVAQAAELAGVSRAVSGASRCLAVASP